MLQIVNTINSYLSDYILVFLLVAVGLWYTVKTKCVQRYLWKGLKQLFGGFSLRGGSQGGGMSSFQAVATAIAAQVGTGNIVGSAGAILVGGPGAIFWMWIIAFLGMATIYAEATLAQKTRVTDAEGNIQGGPVYYIQTAFKGKFGTFLAGFFSIAIILALGFFGCMVQSNSIGSTIQMAFGIPSWIVGIFLVIICGFIFMGGVDRLASVTEKLVPVMAAFFLIGGLGVLAMRLQYIPETFGLIFKYAFQPQAIIGGGFGIAIKTAVSQGAKRGLFSNEAGMGSTPHAHARAKAESPHHQGLCAMISVFIDTFVILNLTVFAVLTTDAMSSGKDGTALTQAAFMQSFGNFGSIFIAICLLFFAFSTILGWHFFGLTNAKYLFGEGAAKVYSFIVVICIVIGSMLKVNLVWALADFFNALMVIPNVLALLALSHVVVAADRKAEAITKNVTQAYRAAEEK